MDDNENKAHEEPKVEVKANHNQDNESVKDLDTDIDTTAQTDLKAEAKAEPGVVPTEGDTSTITPEEVEEAENTDSEPEKEPKVEPEAPPAAEESSTLEPESESEQESEEDDIQEEPENPIEQSKAEEDEIVQPVSEAEVDTTPTEPSLDDTKDNSEEQPTPVEDVTSAEDTSADTPIEDTHSADISTENIPVEDPPKEDEPIEQDKAKSAEAEVQDPAADFNQEREFSESESDHSGSRRESSASSESDYSDRRHSGRSEAIQKAARDIASEIDNSKKRESLNSYSGTDDTGYISHTETISARRSDAHMARSRSGVDEAGENSSHHEQEDDVFSDRSPRSSVGSVSEGDHRKAQEAMSRMSHRVSGVSGISGFSDYDREDEDFIPTIRGNPRPVFRSPSSVKAMQMSSPPGSTVGSPRSPRRAPLSASRLGSPRFSEQYSPKRTPPRFKRSTPPLVLLHVTLLPLRWPWGDVLENADPEDLSKECMTIRDAWRQLQDRMGDTTVERGILLPHPQNDYEVLEERLLEALELPLRRRARILECGHYLGPSNEMTMEDSESDSEEDDYENEDDEQRRSSHRSQPQPTHWCKTCKSDITYESLGRGKIFRVKVYASNGLIRGGAWEACWKEMERVDVELEPLVDAVSQHELVQLEADQERELAMREAEEEERYDRLEEERREFESRERGRLSRRRGESRNHVDDITNLDEGESHLHDASHLDASRQDDSHYDKSIAAESVADTTKDSIKQSADVTADPIDGEGGSRSFEDLEKDIDDHLQEERERSLAEEAPAAQPEEDDSEVEDPSIAPESKDYDAEHLRRDEERLREIYGDVPDASAGHHQGSQRSFSDHQPHASNYGHATPQHPSSEERLKSMKSASLPELLAESARVAMQDKKNILIGLLSILILLLAIRGGPASKEDPMTFQVIRNAEVPTVTVTQGMTTETAEAVRDVTASMGAVEVVQNNAQWARPKDHFIDEDEQGVDEEAIVADSDVNNDIAGEQSRDNVASLGHIAELQHDSCSERIVRVVETVTAVETATVKVVEYATEAPSQETQPADAEEEHVEGEHAQESVAPEGEDFTAELEPPIGDEAPLDEASDAEETILPSEEAKPDEEEGEPAQETESPSEESNDDLEQEVDGVEPSIEAEAGTEATVEQAENSEEVDEL
ncbi:hypothetical protein FHETE_360 [Fusarium heterosporum]|uniref:Pathway-specific nitrogen regulator n=1 Tax=Fusarium heterosporum TaxID=42747 RepID=A0A8H5U263_FUSHE|nr:hypothetical protein FHETE_360 [Fusarium heterosporum]